ncbi:hypothetical protein LCGC14_0687430 [marine sediment metagenome]|uniref:Uncharacterized protein n=1 Tax=marine sediment metagenome TaxID=412755 RepID=A0A0F9R6Q9_9ZZZZ
MKKLINNKKGEYADVFIFIIMSFIIVVFFGIMYYGFTLFDNALGTIQFDIGDTNFTTIVNQTWGQVYDAYGQLRTLAYVLIFGMILTIFVSAWAVRKPPIFLVIWIITSLVGIIAGVYISNAYLLLLNNPDFGSTLQSFTGASYMLLYMPYLAAVISLFSGLISLIGLNRSRREEGQP